MYKCTEDVVKDLEKKKDLRRISMELDPELVIPAIHRRVNAAGGPALLFEKVKGSPFPAVSNLFGTRERAFFLFRHTLQSAQKLTKYKGNPVRLLKNPLDAVMLLPSLWNALPQRSRWNVPAMYAQTSLHSLPQIQSWPKDGGAFVTLPQVYSEHPDFPGVMQSNLGMYRVQISGNNYIPDKEAGVHYQIHRGIGVHHAAAIQKNQPLKVSVFVGGPPSMTLSAVMPLPEGLSELMFAGVMNGRNIRYARKNGNVISADADFVITGTLELHETKPEGPFGDHLGYYSLIHPFPYLKVENVYHRKNAIWPFTVVSRPPAEDSYFGELIHEIASPAVPDSIPGLHALHAVDVAGVHPLLLAVGSERYVPYESRRPMEILTIANAVLGFNQTSLAKYLFMVVREDNPELDIHDIPAYLEHLLERIDFTRDLHFQSSTTMDTLDYSSIGLNEGSKVVFAAAGTAIRKLATELPGGVLLPLGFQKARIVMPGVVAISGKKFSDYKTVQREMSAYTQKKGMARKWEGIALIVLSEDADFTSDMNNFLWETFTKSNPSHDIYGIESFQEFKHFGCHGPLIIDARKKKHHAPELEEDAATRRIVEKLASKGGELYGLY